MMDHEHTCCPCVDRLKAAVVEALCSEPPELEFLPSTITAPESIGVNAGSGVRAPLTFEDYPIDYEYPVLGSYPVEIRLPERGRLIESLAPSGYETLRTEE